MNREVICFDAVAPARERGLKYLYRHNYRYNALGRSREGAWIEISLLQSMIAAFACRSREGAWIEIAKAANRQAQVAVAPARERGLKYRSLHFLQQYQGRSREGAWIEINITVDAELSAISRSREGAWIEIGAYQE